MFAINASGPDPIWRQIEEGVRRLVALGALTPGAAVPSVRDLARELRVNPNTVARAYRELEAAGILETRGRFGTFVARADPADAAMATAAHTYVTAALALGIGKAEALQYVETAFG